MTNTRSGVRSNSSGQLLIIAALAIALLISSTTMYVYELSRQMSISGMAYKGRFILNAKQASRNCMVGSLANITNGGDRAILAVNLNNLCEALRDLESSSVCNLSYTVANDPFYDSGIWLSWNNSAVGVSSACANLTLNVIGTDFELTAEYTANLTSMIKASVSYTILDADKLVTLTAGLFNEGDPTLAKNITLYYESTGNWTQVAASTLDYGNGTYRLVFNVPSNTLEILVNAYDMRGIFVQTKLAMS